MLMDNELAEFWHSLDYLEPSTPFSLISYREIIEPL